MQEEAMSPNPPLASASRSRLVAAEPHPEAVDGRVEPAAGPVLVWVSRHAYKARLG
eukprot:CAMPEP_0197644108 /NCGR_PEP_ID=MMETSP1338-20131121/17197_1 /TAXON_ID=43686 ORGANISM="Pelagodinium beii, Strain RCC1491" /NCGR_SAMPLE_ID=MMETSP1338 /ASSEMBLY_ACC=CAM_ASM_000754 /LENGTH=55 /DNA_ID=CAMNT_0043217443 /DNA_START=313 /DNA_END=480 /DNA_ORIENTATION=-